MITVFIPTPLRKFTGDAASIAVRANTVGEAMQGLATSFPDLHQYLFDAEGNIRKFVKVFVGDSDIHQLNGEATAVKPGDEISIIPAIAGGCFQFSILNS